MQQRPKQEMVEALFSQRNIHDVLHQSIAQQLDDTLINWALGAALRIDNYLEQSYYSSKGFRVAELAEFRKEEGIDRIIVPLLASVIRAKKDQTIQQVIGYLQAHMPHEDHFDRARTAGELLSICGGPGRLYEITRRDSSESPLVQVNLWPILNKLFRDSFEWIDDTFYNPPLVRRPQRVTSRHSCGYITFNEPVLLGKHTQHDNHLDLETINILNEQQWILDPDVVALPEQPAGELKEPQDILNFYEHAEQSRRIYDMLGDEPFHLAHQFDSRGRVYTHGNHVNHQSHQYKKVMLNHNHSEVPT